MITTPINWSLAKCSCPSWSASTDESALRSALANLDACNASLHWWFGFWTVLVAVGVLLEAVFVVWEYRDELHDFGRGLIHAPERPKRVLFVLGLLGTGLVAAGVSGEFWKESQIATVETCIRKGNDGLFLLLSKVAGDAATSATIAHVEAKAAMDVAGKAQQRAGAVEKQTEELNRNLQDSKTQLQAVDAKRAELEKSLINMAVCNAPRVITKWSLLNSGTVVVGEASLGTASKSYVDLLRPMAGQIVFIELVPFDAEARRAALSIKRTLDDAQWKVQIPLKFVDGLADGVSVQPSETAHHTGLANGETAYWKARGVAEKLVKFLHSYNWQAKQEWPLDPQGNMIDDEKVLPAGAIRIQVGLYPAVVYVSPPGQKELTSRMEEQKEYQDKADAELKRKRKEELAALAPELRKKLEQYDAEWDARIKNEMSNNPCQTLNTPF